MAAMTGDGCSRGCWSLLPEPAQATMLQRLQQEVAVTVMSIREFNANVSKAISRVEAGETIDITKSGEIVAELRPKSKLTGEARRAAIERLNAILDDKFGPYTGPITQEDKYGDADL